MKGTEAVPAALVAPVKGERLVRQLNEPGVLEPRLAPNRALLEPERYLCLTDLEDYQLTRYGVTQEVDAAVDEIIAANPPLNDPQEPRARVRTKLGRILFQAVVEANRAAPVPFAEASDLSRLREPSSGLLESALQRLAQHAAVGGSLTEQSFGDAFGVAGQQLFAAWRCLVPRSRGLGWVLRRCLLPVVPWAEDLPLTRAEMQVCEREDPALLEILAERSHLPLDVPLIAAASGLVEDGRFRHVHAVCVQHVLGTQLGLFGALQDRGLAPERVEIVGVPYSTNFVTQYALRQRGYRVETPRLEGNTDVEKVVGAALEKALSRALARCQTSDERILVIDDGGQATRAIHRSFATHAHRFRVVEQTTRGITEVAQLQRCLVPVIDVARSPLKRHESDKIGEEVTQVLRRLLARLGFQDVEGEHVLVVGFGMIGSGVARRLRQSGAKVTVYDRSRGRRREAGAHGFVVAGELHSALREKHVVLGCTGYTVVRRAEIEYLSDQTVLASASSRDVEIDMSLGSDPHVRSLILGTEGPGDDRYPSHLWRFPGKDIVVLHNGFPLNFTGAVETGTPGSIAQTRALMLLGAAQAVGTREPGLHNLSREMQDALAGLAATLAPSQRVGA